MLKPFTRFFALLLVPCLLAEPLKAITLDRCSLADLQCQLNQEAITPSLVLSPLADIESDLAGFFWRGHVGVLVRAATLSAMAFVLSGQVFVEKTPEEEHQAAVNAARLNSALPEGNDPTSLNSVLDNIQRDYALLPPDEVKETLTKLIYRPHVDPKVIKHALTIYKKIFPQADPLIRETEKNTEHREREGVHEQRMGRWIGIGIATLLALILAARTGLFKKLHYLRREKNPPAHLDGSS